MKIDDLKQNVRLVLKGPLELTGFKVGEVAIIDAVGSENVLFKGQKLAVKRDVVLERFVTEPEWIKYQDDLKRSQLIVRKNSQDLEWHDQIIKNNLLIEKLMLRFDNLLELLNKPQTYHKLKVKAISDGEEDEEVVDSKKEISPSPITINALKVFADLDNKCLTEDEYNELYGNSRMFTKILKMGLIVKCGKNDKSVIQYCLSKVGVKIYESGPGRYRVEKYGVLVKIGDSWGCSPKALSEYKASLNEHAKALRS
jgi:hypothetical protein